MFYLFQEIAYYYDLESGTSLMVQLSSQKESKDIFEFVSKIVLGFTTWAKYGILGKDSDN